LEDQLMALTGGGERAKLLMTPPGVAHGVALSLLAALGDLSRFKDGDHAASYLGLVPSTRQSGRHCHHGSITKAGCGPTRTMLIQAAQHAPATPARSAPSSSACGRRRAAPSPSWRRRGSW
jgi:transposase